MPLPNQCKQLLVVITSTLSSVQGLMIPYDRNEKGEWRQAWESFPIVVGKNGMALEKREGDGCSPIGCFPLVQAFGSHPYLNIRMPYFFIQGLEGVDDPASCYYNRLVRREEVSVVDWKSSEKMYEVGEEYDLGVVVGYNWHRPIPHSGSCIFLHVWKGPYSGTAGCTAMEKKEMQRIIEWLDSSCHPHLVQGPKDFYEGFLETAELPALRIP